MDSNHVFYHIKKKKNENDTDIHVFSLINVAYLVFPRKIRKNGENHTQKIAKITQKWMFLTKKISQTFEPKKHIFSFFFFMIFFLNHMKFAENYIFDDNRSFPLVLVRCRCGLIICLGALDSQIEVNHFLGWKKHNIVVKKN